MTVIATGTSALLAAVQASTPSPSPEPALTIYTVSPGIGGFVVFFILALAGWLLFRSLAKHMRTVDRNSRAREEDDRARASDAHG